jgi:CelD/BcsL family acetyltransferase involved in cellulose biosynthesis
VTIRGANADIDLRVSPIVDTTGRLDDWMRHSRPRWGTKIDGLWRRMERDHEAGFTIVEPPRDLDAEFERGFAAESSGWKGRAGTAVLSNPDTERFYRQLARSFHEQGELRLSTIVLDGRVAAFDMCLLHGGRLYLLKTGYDEEFRRLAPGLVIRLATVQRCFELGLAAHELLGDDSEWKRKFATSERRHRLCRLYARRPGTGARYAYRRSRRFAARVYRRLRPEK